MFIFTIIAVASLITSILSTISAIISGKPQHYWLATISIYIFSMIAGFSIGKITVGLTIVLLALAIGYSFNWIKNKSHYTTWLGAGFLVGILMVAFVDDCWLFFPMTL